MSAKWTLASNATAGDRLLDVGQAVAHLSTGDMVQLVKDPNATAPNKVTLQLVPGTAHTTPSTIATLSTDVASASANFVIAGYQQSLALCRDASDNIYVIGTDNVSGDLDNLGAQAFTKGSGLTWTPQSYVHKQTSATEDHNLAAYAAVWCNTGGGTNAKGHILVIAQDTGTRTYYIILDAGALLLGQQSNFIKNSASNPTFLGSGNASVVGSNLALVNDGFGVTSGLAICSNSTTTATVGAWGVTSGGALTTGGGLVDTFATGTTGATTKARVIHYAPNAFVALFRSSVTPAQVAFRVYSAAALLNGSTDLGVAGNFPAQGAGLSWDVTTGATADLKIYVYGWSSALATTMLRLPITMTGSGVPTVGAAFTDDTTVGTAGTTIRAVQQPVDILHTDWQAYQSTSTYGLLGDFSAISSNPNPPTLLTPANNAVAAISTGGTFTWAFTSPVSGDAQTAFNFRRQISGGAYQWWDGAAWQSTSQTITSATSSVTFPTGFWTAGASYTWWVQVTGAAPNNNLSGYSLGFTVVVANPAPTTPTLTSSYDPTLNRTILILTSSDATGPTGSIEASDDGGTTWSTVRGCSALSVNPAAAIVYDYEGPPNATRKYRGRSWTAYPTSYSAYANTQATSSINVFWLKDPTNGATGIQLRVTPGTLQTNFPEFLMEHQALGRSDTIVIADTIGLEDGSASVWTLSATDEAALQALLALQKTLLLQSPDGRSWYIRITSPRPTDTPIGVISLARVHAITWRGQPRP